ncbi:U32 family peptidase [Synechococcus sp. ROS8604]|uniref:U32 family peptidase n=1 Tax=Synechococcus sp. ROS8604 TaxID=1442557 RepID=UPI001648B97E|nr:U32 family peptidase [Synechococcus sp. ROS8604]
MNTSSFPELLSPAGDWKALRAAVSNGADAVYFGVEAFNARLRAENFQLVELPEIMAWLHARGVKGFLTVNVLLFGDELEQAAPLLLAADRAGVDALIVQDLGLCLLAKALVPTLSLHASTQMSITSAAGVAQAAAAGCERVVLARELALRDLERLQNQLKERSLAIPLEVFVHGALCVAYSGQCLTSESLGQRSANRGECAQACRLPYELVVDGESLDLGDQRYLLSPQDLAAWPLLADLVKLGIRSFKIEGRLKDPTYVASVTDAYRRSLDGLVCDLAEIQRQLELGFSRGLSTGWLRGIDHRALVHGRWSKKRGPVIGELVRVESKGWLVLQCTESPRNGQGLVLEATDRQDDPLTPPREIGGRVMEVKAMERGLVRLRIGPGRVDLSGLRSGSSVWLTSDPQWQSTWQRRSERVVSPLERGLHIRVSGQIGEVLELELIEPVLPGGECCSVTSQAVLEPARDHGLDRERLVAQLGRLGGTGWCLEHLETNLGSGLFLPVAELNRMRRSLLQQMADGGLTAAFQQVGLEASSERVDPQPIVAATLERLADWRDSAQPQSKSPSLVVLVRSLEQLRALQDMGDGPMTSVIADLEHPKDLKEAVAIGRGCWPDGIWLAGPRITRPGERWMLEPLLKAKADGYLVRNADQLELLTGQAPCAGDFTLNVANPLSLLWFLETWGLDRVTASCDLNLSQLLDLVQASPPERIEVVLHQHMPLFHMEHCLFCSFLSEGHDHTDCGRPCEQHTVMLRDRSGVEHPLKADLGCRNTLFNGKPQTGVEALSALRHAGIHRYRLDLLDEGAEATLRRVQLYSETILGRTLSADVWRREQIDHKLGVTRGSLRIGRENQALQVSC